MATIRAYTTIEQSCKLAEILPLESADKHWIILDGAILRATTYDYFDLREYNQDKGTFREYIPCWSLAALLSTLPDIHLKKYTYDGITKYYATLIGIRQFNSKHYDNLVDACYEIIIHLHELNLL